MKTCTALLALTGLAILTAAAPSGTQNSCGKCDTLPGPNIGGNAQIPLRKSATSAYKCITLSEEVRLSGCAIQNCGLCVMFEGIDCYGNILHWGGSGVAFEGKGTRSYFCV